MHVVVVADAPAVAATVAERTVRAASDAPGRLSLGLAGGSTPMATYRLLSKADIDWSNVDLWLGDERWVPWEHEDSNGQMVIESLGDPESMTLHRPRWSETLEPEGSAAFYDAELRRIHDGESPDLVLLGMGDDGHTASLFPGTSALLEPDDSRWYVANHVPQLETWRLTATPWLLTHAKQVIVLVTGVAKAGVLREVLEGPSGKHPIQLLESSVGSVTYVVDRAAASQLSER